ncbi:helix-turn-helix DNA binding domain protein [Microbacterium phage Pepe25]|nr:helix-turn-helix DNA binding domain protein [Microbacterium phage Pepe25]
MAKRERPRFIPPHLGKRDLARVATIPRWFMREAVMAFGLNSYDIAAFCIIADNLDAEGTSRTATTLIADRGGMSKGAANAALARLIAADLIHTLDPPKKGHIMRYAISPDTPWYDR